MLGQLVVGFVILAIIFIPLERLFPIRKEQRIIRKGWFNDLCHFFINRFLIVAGTYGLAVILYILFHRLLDTPLQKAVASQPAWLEFLEAFLIAEIAFYTLHRLAHTIPWLWKLHAVHHSSQEMDWLASARLHPLEMIIANIWVGLPLVLLGFSAESFGVWSLISTFLAILNHSNVRVSFGPLRWLIADPQFHHWHHANEPQAINKNFSGLPLLDKVMGTAYMPKERWPHQYGIDDYMPRNYLKQLAYPFQKRKS